MGTFLMWSQGDIFIVVQHLASGIAQALLCEERIAPANLRPRVRRNPALRNWLTRPLLKLRHVGRNIPTCFDNRVRCRGQREGCAEPGVELAVVEFPYLLVTTQRARFARASVARPGCHK